MPIITWVKKNKLTTALLIIVAYFIYKNFFGVSIQRLTTTSRQYESSGSTGIANPVFGPVSGAPASGIGKISLPNIYPPQQDYTPQPDATNRLVIQESNLSLLAKDVVDTRNKILAFATSVGGYMVNASTSNPQDAPTATVVIRVPSAKLQEALDYFHSLSIKVVSENLVGRDVTDQYVDIDKRIATYEKIKAKYEDLLDRATTIQDITNLTQQVINIQSQIDSLKGQQESLKQNANLAKLTIYLSTDEIALPYAPSETFRPNVIFKLAVRALVGTLRKFATYAIWIGVYSVVWIPVVIIYIVVRKWLQNRRNLIKQ